MADKEISEVRAIFSATGIHIYKAKRELSEVRAIFSAAGMHIYKAKKELSEVRAEKAYRYINKNYENSEVRSKKRIVLAHIYDVKN